MSDCPKPGMTAAVDREHGFDQWERRERRLFAALPYVMLGVATVITLLQDGYPLRLWLVLLLSAVAAAWTALFQGLNPRWRERHGLMVGYFAGFLVLAGLLIAEAPWFGMFGWVGFIHAFDCLRGKWRFAGLAATSMLMALAQIGGVPEGITVADILTWVLVAALNLAVAGAFTYLAFITKEHNVKRKESLLALEETNAKLESALAENAGLHAQLMVQAREAGALDERQRLAAEIHDTLAQGFTGIITQLQAAEQGRDDRLRWQRHLDTAAALARENLAEARRSVRAMSPQALATAPLSEALQDLADRWSAIRDTRVQFTATGTARPMHPELEATLLRVTQEALSNVDKHAKAKRVGVTLSYMEDQITLDVRDDGVGFDMSAPASNGDGGFGLTGMRRRVQRLAGALTVESEPGGGTAVSASLPALEMLPDGPQLADGVLAVPRQDLEIKEPAE